MPHDVPSLLCLRDMKRHLLDVRVLKNTIELLGKSQPLSIVNGLLVHIWKPDDADLVMYTEDELRKLHRSFGHPTVRALENLLRRARPEEMSPEVVRALESITASCKPCVENASKPRRFRLTVGSEDLRFNHVVAIDVMYINNRPILHVVDEGTHYQTARFLKNMSSKEVWKTLRNAWIEVYLGPPDFLRVDQGSNFTSSEFKGSAASNGISVIQEPIESPSSMSHVERYHQPLRSAYEKLRSSLSSEYRDADVLQMAVKAVNDTIGPEGLCPTLLVYGCIPRPARTLPALSQIERARAIDKVTKEVEKEHAKRKVAFAKRYRGPYGRERTDLLNSAPGTPVLVYREHEKQWTGPFPFVSIDGDTVVVQLPTGRKIFRSHVVKRYEVDDARCVSNANICCQSDGTSDTEQCDIMDQGVLAALFGKEGEISCLNVQHPSHSFKEARTAELQGLQEQKVFRVVKRSSLAKGTRVYKTKWIDVIKKNDDGSTREKSRLVAQNFRDTGAHSIATRSPTVTRLSQRLMLASAAIHKQHKLYTRDITQAYLQSHTNLERPVYLQPPPEMGLGDDEVLLVLKPLYGIPESGLHWFATYHSHHVTELDMNESRADRCLLYRCRDGHTDAVAVLQVDDSCGHGSDQFLEAEDQGSLKFKCKPRTILKTGMKVMFNGSDIIKTAKGYTTVQESKLTALQEPSNAKELVSTRAALQYIAGCTRPDLSSSVQLLSSAVGQPSPVKETYTEMTRIVRRATETADMGIQFVALDPTELSLFLFTDASFANAHRFASQLGFVVCLVDKDNNANIIHYGSQRCKRVTRSVMAAELHALVYGFDNAYVAKTMAEEIFGNSIPINAFIDSRTVFNTITKSGSTLEKRLQIDAYALRQSHQNGELSSLAWIPTEQNVADALTKTMPPKAHCLAELMTTNKVKVNPQGWVNPDLQHTH